MFGLGFVAYEIILWHLFYIYSSGGILQSVYLGDFWKTAVLYYLDRHIVKNYNIFAIRLLKPVLPRSCMYKLHLNYGINLKYLFFSDSYDSQRALLCRCWVNKLFWIVSQIVGNETYWQLLVRLPVTSYFGKWIQQEAIYCSLSSIGLEEWYIYIYLRPNRLRNGGYLMYQAFTTL